MSSDNKLKRGKPMAPKNVSTMSGTRAIEKRVGSPARAATRESIRKRDIRQVALETQGDRLQTPDTSRQNATDYRVLFDYSAVPMVIVDYSSVKEFFDDLRTAGIRDFRAYCRSHPVGSSRSLTSGKVIEANRESLKFFGVRSAAQLEAQKGLFFTDGVGTPFGEALIALVEGAATIETSVAMHTKGGESRTANIRFLVAPEYGSTLSRILITITDITERKRAEEERRYFQAQLTQAHKMESIGRLAGGVAHDFSNLLSVILGYTEMLLGSSSLQNGTAREWIQEIHEAGERARDLTRQLLAFSRNQVLEFRLLDLNQLIVDFEKIIRRLIGEHIQVDLSLDPDIGPIKADGSQIEQVLLNLAANARDAMRNGGRLVFKTEKAAFSSGRMPLNSGLKQGDYVILTVQDTGIGMDLDTQRRLFEPFFTTKEQGKGTGLGLTTVYGIVKQHGGDITVQSKPAQGTTFIIFLPEAADIEASETTVPKPSRPLCGGETILIVEDDSRVRRLVCGMLGKLGYNVIEAEGSKQAVRIAGERKPIHLLLADVMMPEMNGWQVYQRVSALHPKVKALFISGYTQDVIAQQGMLDEHTHLLQKPFTADSLTRKIQELLAE